MRQKMSQEVAFYRRDVAVTAMVVSRCNSSRVFKEFVMQKPTGADHFNQDAARGYDERNRKLAPIAHCMHFLIQLALADLPPNAHILCVGVGTGAEILSLARAFPGWTFTGVDPSASMLAVCAERLNEAGIQDRCQLVPGYVQDVAAGETYDAALSILVAHFITREDRLGYFREMTSRLKPGGSLVNAEISFDLSSPEFPAMLKNWEKVQALMGVTPDKLANLPQLLRDMLTVLQPQETENLLRQSGIPTPVSFFEAFMIHGWHGTKTPPVSGIPGA
jgi:tRNA (cmo5U34)-methyltransferase